MRRRIFYQLDRQLFTADVLAKPYSDTSAADLLFDTRRYPFFQIERNRAWPDVRYPFIYIDRYCTDFRQYGY